MPTPVAELRRGRIVWALFPFAPAFPLDVLPDEGHRTRRIDTVDAFARERRGQPARIVAQARLRPVLLLHDGTRGEHEDVVCLRVNSVRDRHRRLRETWPRIEDGTHPIFHLLRAGSGSHGLPVDALVALTSIGTVHKSAIVGRPVGQLDASELRSLSERLVRALGLDLTGLIASRARELVAKARGQGAETT
jgi:hypothetical protein